MADQTGKSDNNPKKPISEEEYKKGLISDIRPIQARPGKKDPLENLTGSSGDFADTEDIEDEEDQEIVDDESSEEEQDDQPELSRDDIERLTKDQRIKETPEQQLEKNKVPEYKAEPPEAYKKPPGGPAIKPTGTAAKAEQGVAKAGQGAAKTAQGAAQGAKNTAQAAAKAGQAAVKAIQATVAGIRNAVAAIGALFSSAPAWVPVVLIILGILIIVGAVVIFLKARSTPNANGASPTIAADVFNDRELIFRILALSNDPNASQNIESMLSGLEGELTNVESMMQRSPYSSWPEDTKNKISEKINNIKELITKFRSTPVVSNDRKTIASDIIKNLGELLDLFSPAPFYYITGPGNSTAYPVALTDIKGYNTNPHGGTAITKPIAGHGTFEQNNKGTSDAVDVMGDEGTKVYAAFGGDVVSKFEYIYFSKKRGRNLNFGWVLKIKGKDAEGKEFLAIYAHLKNPTSKRTVAAGEPIGEMKSLGSGIRTHLHFEMYREGKAVTTSREEYNDSQSGSPRYSVYGKYLWVKILNTLKLSLQ